MLRTVDLSCWLVWNPKGAALAHLTVKNPIGIMVERERNRESQLSINVTAGAQRGVSVASEGARCTASSSSVDEELMGDSLADKLSHLINYRWFFWFVIALPAE
jgi:hypothetical protein